MHSVRGMQVLGSWEPKPARNAPLPPCCPSTPPFYPTPLQGCLEDQLTPEALAKGYRHSDAAALGFTPARELQLTLTDQPPAFYSAASLAYWRKARGRAGSRHVAGCAAGGRPRPARRSPIRLTAAPRHPPAVPRSLFASSCRAPPASWLPSAGQASNTMRPSALLPQHLPRPRPQHRRARMGPRRRCRRPASRLRAAAGWRRGARRQRPGCGNSWRRRALRPCGSWAGARGSANFRMASPVAVCLSFWLNWHRRCRARCGCCVCWPSIAAGARKQEAAAWLAQPCSYRVPACGVAAPASDVRL